MPAPTIPGIWADDQTLVEATDPQWLEGFQYLETTNNGKPRTYDLDYPLKKLSEIAIWAIAEIETLQTSLSELQSEKAESIGDVYYRAVDDAPSNSLYCDGSAVSRTTYADLFAKIGTTYGVGDGSTTFNVPELRAEFIRGWDDGRGIDSGRAFGSYQDDEFESHNHDVVVRSSNDSTTNTSFNDTLKQPTGSQNYTLSSKNTGGAETRPRNVALKPFIRFK